MTRLPLDDLSRAGVVLCRQCAVVGEHGRGARLVVRTDAQAGAHVPALHGRRARPAAASIGGGGVLRGGDLRARVPGARVRRRAGAGRLGTARGRRRGTCDGRRWRRRGRVARRRARATAAAWTANATPIVLDGLSGTGIRAFVMEEQFPVVSLVGLWRPRLFIARHVIEALTPTSCASPWPTRSRIAARGTTPNACSSAPAPDLLGWWAVGHGLERQWAAAAECAADRRAVADSRTADSILAAALVKVSRLAVGPAPGVLLFSTLHEHGDIAARVSRLVSPAPDPQPRSIRVRVIVTASAALVVWASLPWIFPAVHALTENCLRLLP